MLRSICAVVNRFLGDHLEAEIVLDMGLGRAFHHIGRQMGRNKQDAAARAKNHVAGQAYRAAEMRDVIKAGHHEFADRRWIDAAVIHLHIGDFFHLLYVPDAAPYHRAAGFCPGTHSGCQVAAQKGALINFIVHVGDNHVPFHEAVHHPLVVIPLAALLGALLKHNGMKIRTRGTEIAGNSPADELSSVVVQSLHGLFSAAHELVFIAQQVNGLPHLLQRHLPQRVQIAVRHLRPAVGQPLALPKRRQGEDFFPVVKLHGGFSFLCANGGI